MNVNGQELTDVTALQGERLQRAYDSLSREDQLIIDMLAQQLENGVKLKHGGTVAFGRTSALELLAKLGVLMYYKQPIGVNHNEQ
jgi:hypothetical protein